MCTTLKVNPSVRIDVDSSEVIKHCGFGSSSSTIAAVASAINELREIFQQTKLLRELEHIAKENMTGIY